MQGLEIIRYRTARQCLAAFHGCKPSEVGFNGTWEFYDRDGTLKRLSQKECLANIQHKGCWGWCSNKKVIHVWISSRAKMADAISLIAHEMGHCMKPWLPFRSEEIKASKYEEVTSQAVQAYLKLTRR